MRRLARDESPEWYERALEMPPDAVPYYAEQASGALGGTIEVPIASPNLSVPTVPHRARGLRIATIYGCSGLSAAGGALPIAVRMYKGNVLDREYPLGGAMFASQIQVYYIFKAAEIVDVPDIRIANRSGTLTSYVVQVAGWYF